MPNVSQFGAGRYPRIFECSRLRFGGRAVPALQSNHFQWFTARTNQVYSCPKRAELNESLMIYLATG
jgi:hypothetical protein